MAALQAIPDTDYGKSIIDTLKLQATLSNPKLAITILMPEDQVKGVGGGVDGLVRRAAVWVWFGRWEVAVGQQGGPVPMPPPHTTQTKPNTTTTKPNTTKRQYFDKLASELGTTTKAMYRNVALMRQVLFYHFVTGSNGVKAVYPAAALKPGMKLDTMYISTGTKKPYQLSVIAGADGRPAIKSVGTTAQIVTPNVRCGAGYAHIIDNVLAPMTMAEIKKLI
jgi:hypothetical protein